MKFLTLPLLAFCITFTQAQVAVVKFDRIEKLLSDRTSDKIQVINFWATWCGPCVKELPLFETFQAEHHNAKITLVSLDYADKLEKVNAFVAKRKIKSDVLLLDEPDGNTWIDQVEPNWGGAIPITIIIDPKTGRRKFIDKELKEGDLEKAFAELISIKTN